MIPITSMTDEIFHRNLKINLINRKREVFSNEVYNIERYTYTFKEI